MNLRPTPPHLRPFLHSILALSSVASAAAAQLGVEIAGPLQLTQALTGSTNHSAFAHFAGSQWVGGNSTTPGLTGSIHELSLSGTHRSATGLCPTPAQLESPPLDFAWLDDCLVSVKQSKVCCYEKTTTGLQCILETLAPAPMDSIACDPSTGRLYGTLGTNAITVFTLDPQSAAIQVVGTLPPSGKVVRGLAWNPVTQMLWAACANNPLGGPVNLVEFNEINPSTGALTGQSFLGRTALAPPNILAGCEIYFDVRNPGKLSIGAVHRSSPAALMVYDLGTPYVCDGDPRTYCTAKTNSLGCLPSIASSGAPSATSGAGFVVQGSNVLNNKSGLLFYSLLGRSAAPFQGGFKCVASPTRRTPVVASGGSAPPVTDCSGMLSLDMNAFAVGALGGGPDIGLVIPGSTVRCQWWSRDPASVPSGASLSNGLEYDVCP